MAIVSNKKGGSRYLLGFVTILLLYCFIFNPPFRFLPVGLTKFMYIMALPFFLVPMVRRNYWTRFSSITLLLVLYILYTFFVRFVFSSNASYAIKNVFVLFESFFTAYVIAFYLVKCYRDKADLMILWTAIVACVVTVVLILKPNLNAYVRELFVLLDDERLKDLAIYRGFGIADDLLFTYPIALSIGSCICLQYARKNVSYYGFILLFLIGIFFNARIGMIPIVIYFIYVIFIERRILLLLKISIVVVLLLFFLFDTGFLEEYEATINWLAEGFLEMSSLFAGEEQSTGTFGNLSAMIVVPQTVLGLVLGTGKDIYLSASNNSDIGYVLQLNYGGIIYVLFFFFIVINLYKNLKKYNSPHNGWFNFVFIGTFLICNIKGYFFSTLSGVRMLMLLYFVYVLSRNTVSYQEN